MKDSSVQPRPATACSVTKARSRDDAVAMRSTRSSGMDRSGSRCKGWSGRSPYCWVSCSSVRVAALRGCSVRYFHSGRLARKTTPRASASISSPALRAQLASISSSDTFSTTTPAAGPLSRWAMK